jgi:uncharacterized protein YjiS (DUF1127 family)
MALLTAPFRAGSAIATQKPAHRNDQTIFDARTFDMTGFITTLLRNAARRRATLRLLDLDDHLLNDIGVTRHDLQAGRYRRAAR